ncbi:membrane protein [Flavobacterium rivuli WB 3.3-2 = DSM 21788]|uniref:Membrane protein n=1 Tax=Flavobacterium rivuli WB 3.3-2 = DSM 21788 TaxID=1121895 RepID=A0A0A2LWP9_9FLAO|nr:hypothetical protein [Flavobacterium rivuli]KGO84787.1 membrane protein [Flavobacterium rivuli WB 3.3-2 = DSM 21788]
MILIASKYIVPKGYIGITLYPFIIVRERQLMQHPVLLNHERIHLRQQAELLILPFYVWYVIEYLIRLLMYRNRKQAYRNIGFEREAYANESNPGYLKHRQFWNFLKFINT